MTERSCDVLLRIVSVKHTSYKTMKPVKLVMSAFGPFGSCQTIEFDKIGNNNLFLISGDTGSGKTTIFDAITFALFGTASGDIRTDNSFCSGFAEENLPTFVELDFLHKGKIYHIHRNPEYKRLAKRGNKFVMEKKDALLRTPDGELITDFDKVTNAVQELLGVDIRQFKQISMIAQGEFIKLLNADSGERGKIFRKAFKTEHLEEFQKKLSEECNARKKICEDMDRSILQDLDGILTTKEWESTGKLQKAKKEKDALQLEELIEKCITEQECLYQEVNESLTDLNESILENTEKKAAAELQKKQQEALEQLKKQKNALILTEDIFQKKEQKRQEGKKAFYHVRPFVLECRRAKERLKEQQELLNKTENALEGLYKNKSAVTKKYEETKEKKIEIEKLTEEIQKVKIESLSLKKAEDLDKVLKQKETKRINDQEKLNQFIIEGNDCAKEIKETEEQIYLYESSKSEREKLLYEEKENQDIRNQVKAMEKQIGNLEQLKTELKKKQTLYMKAERIWQDSDVKLKEANGQFRREMAGILAEELEEGRPCPVCGSAIHPHAAKKTEKILNEKDLEALEKNVEELRKKRDDCCNQCGEWKTRIELEWNSCLKHFVQWREQWNLANFLSVKGFPTENNTLLEREAGLLSETEVKESLKRAVIVLEEAEADFQKKIQHWNEREVQIEECRIKIEELKESYKKQEKKTKEIQEEVSALDSEIIQIQAERKSLREEKNFKDLKTAEKWILENKNKWKEWKAEVRQAEKDWEKFQKDDASLNGEKKQGEKQLKIVTAQYKMAETEQKKALKEQEFADIEHYEEALTEESELEALESEIAERNQMLLSVQKNIEKSEQEIKKEVFDLEQIDNCLNECRKQKKIKENQIQQIFHYLDSNKKIKKNVWEKEKKQQEMKQEYLMIRTLSQTANGELSGKQKIKFEQYVQAFYFRKVIIQANKRLKKMAGGRFELRYLEAGKDKRSKSGLEVEVMDYYTGMSRPISSLSGGESFQAALSLSLGLSDIIQNYAGGIEVDALFIDEGFGTLDESSLELAIETLKGLTDSSRMVGIISHVNELKERMEQQILIHKTERGSTVEIPK